MEENYETLEEELGQLRAEPPPQKPDQQIHSPETYATKNIQEEMSPPRPGPEPKISAKDPSFSETAYPSKTLPTQNLSETETPWENITLNHCLFVTITILVITSGFHKLHEAVHGAPDEVEECAVTAQHSGALQHRPCPTELEPSLWDVMIWWLPDLDDEDDEDKDRVKSKRRTTHTSSHLRKKPQPNKNLMKQADVKLKNHRAKKIKTEELISKKKGQHRKATNVEDQVYKKEVPVKKKLVKKDPI
ncbi:uncharacterized protein LOC117522004 isoform X2 [Thalassophryne amazonica]|nr:uncharacterized protein LOC117522004 isoform X2 [Thalassophryne amazonica]